MFSPSKHKLSPVLLRKRAMLALLDPNLLTEYGYTY
jgi:hypothetical protein